MSNLLNKSLAGISDNRGSSSRNSPYARPAAGNSNDRWQHDMFQDAPHKRGGNRSTNKLIVTGLHYEVTEAELDSLFTQMGELARKPYIKYDHSGRSTGMAYITYKSTTDAIEAKNEYDGAKAKGATISITFDQTALRSSSGPRGGAANAGNAAARGGKAARGGSHGSGDSLLGRLSGKDLLSRLGGEGAPSSAPKGPKANPNPAQNPKSTSRPGPVRSVSGNNPRGGKSSRGGRGGNNKSSTKTAGDLDSELEAFMKAPPGSVAGANGTEQSDHAPMDTD